LPQKMTDAESELLGHITQYCGFAHVRNTCEAEQHDWACRGGLRHACKGILWIVVKAVKAMK